MQGLGFDTDFHDERQPNRLQHPKYEGISRQASYYGQQREQSTINFFL
jgi:hypothetical protein